MSEPGDSIVRKTVSLPSSTWKQIEDFQFANRIKRETEAIRRLIDLGLTTAKKPERYGGSPI
jgi:hypothetical protein